MVWAIELKDFTDRLKTNVFKEHDKQIHTEMLRSREI